MNICIFCGSSTGHNPVYADSAREIGKLLASQHHTLVYGGGNIGLMGIVADAVLESRGHVIGVIPDFLMQKEVGHRGLTELEIVPSMHDRKKRMADLSDAFIAMPGGWGTLDETAEILTWKQLGLIQQPLGVLNVNGFFDTLLLQMNLMVKEGFLNPVNLQSVQVSSSPMQLLSLLLPQ
ncbi:MAG TPA: TIGR00730 family Rossman fold protein [Cyclobacteriaceae bacterium]|nr:TIGR00730 family Rossman fold protein [Cyclobacteriaceae bacterium]